MGLALWLSGLDRGLLWCHPRWVLIRVLAASLPTQLGNMSAEAVENGSHVWVPALPYETQKKLLTFDYRLAQPQTLQPVGE